jgi:hypothetical protein
LSVICGHSGLLAHLSLRSSKWGIYSDFYQIFSPFDDFVQDHKELPVIDHVSKKVIKGLLTQPSGRETLSKLIATTSAPV